MRRVIVAVICAALVGSGLIAPTAAFACPPPTYRAIAEYGDPIFVGRIVAKRVVSAEEIRYRFEVLRRIKGRPGDYQRVISREQYGFYGPIDLAVGKRVLVVNDNLGYCTLSQLHDVSEAARAVKLEVDKLAGRRPSRHVVQDGDWLWGLARHRLRFDGGTPTPRQIRRAADAIYERNRYRIGPDPDHLPVGITLRIPVLR